MTPQGVRKQLDEVYSRLLIANLSVKQFYAKSQQTQGGGCSIGSLPLGSISLRDIPYKEIYTEIETKDGYHIKLPDGGLMIFQYIFDGRENLLKHRLCYFPSYELPPVDEAPALYEKDELYGDVIVKKLVRFPIRFDYDPVSHKDIEHPKSHITFGQYENCRIPVDSAVSPNAFVMFLLRNFYSRSFQKNKNTLSKKPYYIHAESSITGAEKKSLTL